MSMVCVVFCIRLYKYTEEKVQWNSQKVFIFFSLKVNRFQNHFIYLGYMLKNLQIVHYFSQIVDFLCKAYAMVHI